MSPPTDRGFVVIDTEANGTKTVHICAELVRGEPVSVFARYTGSTAVSVEPGVVLTAIGSRSISRGVVEVVHAEGKVMVRPVAAVL